MTVKEKKVSQKQQVINLLQLELGQWVPSYKFVKVVTAWGWIGTSGDRRARELSECNINGEPIHIIFVGENPYIVERKDFQGYAHYRLVPKNPSASQLPIKF